LDARIITAVAILINLEQSPLELFPRGFDALLIALFNFLDGHDSTVLVFER
jgi:hypothetical protein